jgi:hypothetical protein
VNGGDEFFPYVMKTPAAFCKLSDLVAQKKNLRHAEAVVRSVHCQGTFEEWLKAIKPLRHESVAVRIALTAAFASAFLDRFTPRLDAICHFYGDAAEDVQAVLLAASSIYANPTLNDPQEQYITPVGNSVTMDDHAFVLGTLPMMIDGTQSIDQIEVLQNRAIEMMQGQRALNARLNPAVRSQSWCFIEMTGGLAPITTISSAPHMRSYSINIPVEASISEKVSAADGLLNNFGHAGKKWVEWGMANMTGLPLAHQTAWSQVSSRFNTQCKDAVSLVSWLMAVDRLTSQVVFDDRTVDDLIPMEELIGFANAFCEEGVYRHMLNWLSTFVKEHEDQFVREGAKWPASECADGLLSEKEVCIRRTLMEDAFASICPNEKGGFGPFLEWCKDCGILRQSASGNMHMLVQLRDDQPDKVDCYVFRKDELYQFIKD